MWRSGDVSKLIQRQPLGQLGDFAPRADVKRMFALAVSLSALALLLTSQGAAAADVTFVLEARNLRWNPSSLIVNQGDVVTIVIFNNDTTISHTFELTGYALRVDLPPGESGRMTFTANVVGTFQYWCAVPGHAQFDPATNRYTGMAGTFTVRASSPPQAPGLDPLLLIAAIAVVVAIAIAFVVVRRRRAA